MARWLLLQKHYLNVPDTYWEYKEQPQGGRVRTMRIPVPLFLDPEDILECNYNADGSPRSQADIKAQEPGAIIVCWEGKGLPKDIVFFGDPTPDMRPLDPEAEEISATFAKRWGTPLEDMEDGYGMGLIRELSSTLSAFNAQQKPSTMMPDDGRLSALEAQVKMLAEMNAKLIEQNTALAEARVERRVR